MVRVKLCVQLGFCKQLGCKQLGFMAPKVELISRVFLEFGRFPLLFSVQIGEIALFRIFCPNFEIESG